jgi:hypothetical protein
MPPKFASLFEAYTAKRAAEVREEARAEAAREEAARAEAERDRAAEMEAALAVLAVHGRGTTNTRLLERIKCLILLARSFEIRLDSTDEQWKLQFKQNALLLECVSDLKSRMDKLDAEKFVVARRVATCKFAMICVVLGAIIVLALREYLEYPHTESTARTLT